MSINHRNLKDFGKKITRNVKDFEIYKQEVTKPEALGIVCWVLRVDTGKQNKKKCRQGQTSGSYCWHFHQEFKRVLKKYMQEVTEPETLGTGGWVLGIGGWVLGGIDTRKQNNGD